MVLVDIKTKLWISQSGQRYKIVLVRKSSNSFVLGWINTVWWFIDLKSYQSCLLFKRNTLICVSFFVCFSVPVQWRTCHRAGEAAVRYAFPVCGPSVPVPDSVLSSAGGTVVVQVLLSRPYQRVLHPAWESGRPDLGTGRHLPPGVLRQQPHSTGGGLCTRSLLNVGRALQRQRHHHHKQ